MLGTSSCAIERNGQNSLLGKNNRQTGRCAFVFSPQTQSPYRENTFSYGNAASAQLVGGINLYGYVGGNPVMWNDPMGLIRLPENPGGLPSDWEHDPTHKDPNSSKWRNPQGGCLEFAPGEPGRPGWAGKPHWHDCSDPKDKKRRDKHWQAGETCPQPGESDQSNAPGFSPIPGENPNEGHWWSNLPPPFIIPNMPGSGGGGGGGFLNPHDLIPLY